MTTFMIEDAPPGLRNMIANVEATGSRRVLRSAGPVLLLALGLGLWCGAMLAAAFGGW